MTKLQVINNVTANTTLLSKTIGTQTTTNPSEKALSTTTKVVIGTALTALAATGIYIATRGKVGSKQATKLAGHINFQPSKTLEEARAFARNNLGITRYELTNLDIANYVNEGLVHLSNSVKGSTMYYEIRTLPSDCIGRMISSFDGKILGINEKQILESMKVENLQALFNRTSCNCNLSHYDLSTKQLDLITKFKTNPSILSLKEKLEFEELMTKIELSPSNLYKRYTEALANDTVLNAMKQKNRVIKPDDFFKLTEKEKAKYVEELFDVGYKQPIYAAGAFKDLNHEFGHKLHAENIGKEKFSQIGVNVVGNPEQSQKAVGAYMKKFIERNPSVYPILREISAYAPCSEAEAVAEIYAGLQNGVKYDDKIMTLFEKWGGVKPL